MRTFRAKTGPFAEAPYFELAEIESICTEALKQVDLYPTDPEQIRIDRFVEKRFGVHETYDDLPAGLLGFTRFDDKGQVVEIVVAKALDEEGTVPAERRLRTTLAHEAGHGLLHARLFAGGERPQALFGDGLAADAPKILCRDGAYRWWEFQANQAMGALLLPKALVGKALASTIVHQGLLGLPVLPNDRRESAVRLIADTFHVNPVVARIRLEALFPSASASQLTL
jgi:hypothetical protein